MKIFNTLLFNILLLAVSCTSKNIKEANQIIHKVEEYRKLENRLPDNLNAIGIKETEEGPVFYKKIDSLNYIVWIQANSSVGDSKIYYSDSKKWEEGYRKIKTSH